MMTKEIKIACKGADSLSIDKLIDFQGDLKKITPENMQKLKNNIIKNNFSAPIFVWKKTAKSKAYILDGHSRVKALLELKKEGHKIPSKLPVDYIRAATKKEAKEKLLGIASQYGQVTDAGFMDFINEANINISDLIGEIEIPNIDIRLPEKPTVEDDEIPAEVKPITKLGDLWELGKHRVLCGDCTTTAAVQGLMEQQKDVVLLTSPPYSDMRTYGGGDMSIDKLKGFIAAYRPYAKLQLINLGIQRKHGEVNEYWQEYIKEAKRCGYKLISWNVWNREGHGGSVGAVSACFPIEHEWILVFGHDVCLSDFNKIIKNKHAGEPRKGGDRLADGSIGIQRPRRVNQYRRLGTVLSVSFERDIVNKKRHPAVFPVALPETYIEATTNKNCMVADPFLGSGSTLIACEKTNRICYGMEIDKHYCDVIVQRYKDWCTKNNRKIKIKLNGKIRK